MRIRIKSQALLGLVLAASIAMMPAPVSAAVPTIEKVKVLAGDGQFGYQDGTATEAQFSFPYGIAMDNTGGLIIVDSYNNRIRRYQDGTVTTIAGFTDQTDTSGFTKGGYADGEAAKARFNHPRGAAVDSKGNIYISDSENNAIRIIADGKVYTFAGAAKAGYTDAKGNKARFNLPSGIAIDSKDNLYVADTLNHVIRRITPDGTASTIAGHASEAGGYLDGTASEALFNEPSDLAIGNDGAIYVLDSGNQLLRRIKDGMVSTIAGVNNEKLTGTTYAKGGFLNGTADKAMFNFPMGIDIAEDGTIFIADTYNHRIRVIKENGYVGTLAGSGVPGLADGFAEQTEFNGPSDVLYRNGVLYISDMWNNCIRSLKLDLKDIKAAADRSEIEASYQFDTTTDELQVWYAGSRITFPTVKPYVEGNKVYVPLKYVTEAWGAKVRWIIKYKKLLIRKPGFYHIFSPGVDMTFKKQGYTYIDIESLGRLTGLRVEWFPEYHALVLEERVN